jgi:hypothetical protein
MNVQIYTNTKLKTKELIGTKFPFSKETFFVRTYNNGNGFEFSSETKRLSSWRGMCNFQLNEVGAMLTDFISEATIDEIVQVNKLDISTDNLENFVAERFLAIPSVEFVFLSIEKDSIDIWTVINKSDRKVRGKIYDVEYEILGILKESQFDFHVMCRDDRNIEEVRPFGAKMIFRK